MAFCITPPLDVPPAVLAAVGQEYVQNTLTTMDPLSAIQVGAPAACLVCVVCTLGGLRGWRVAAFFARDPLSCHDHVHGAHQRSWRLQTRAPRYMATHGAARACQLLLFCVLPPLQDIQNRGALQDPRCGPLIGLMDQLGLTRHALCCGGTSACSSRLIECGR